MKCKNCGRELMPGAKKCVYCGAAVPASDSQADDEFRWNVQDFPKPRKQTNVDIDWGGEKITDKDSGRTYFQKESRWREPEEARSMFNFDMTHENLQQEVDKQLNNIATDEPAPAARSRRNDDIFVLPSDMQMEDFSDLLNDIDDYSEPEAESQPEPEVKAEPEKEKRPEPERPVYRESRKEPERPVWDISRLNDDGPRQKKSAAGKAKAPKKTVKAEKPAERKAHPETHRESGLSDTLRREKKSGGASRTPVREKYEDYDPFKGMGPVDTESMPDFLKDIRGLRDGKKPEKKGREPETAKKPAAGPEIERGYTEEEERRAVKGFQNLINAEKTFSDNMEKAAYMSEDELEKVREADEKREGLTEKANISFRTIEDEYERFRKAREEEESREEAEKKAERPARTIITSVEPEKPAKEEKPAETEKSAGTGETKENGGGQLDFDLPSEPVDSLRHTIPRRHKKKVEDNPREVNIKINEPSGTKYTVKTQEIDLVKLQGDKIKTQPVDLSKINQGPKSVQVQVEVSSSQSSSSVEVTRRHDGATVVKTLENGTENEHECVPENAREDEHEKDSFWEKKSDSSNRMTITDIFGPEAKDFRDKWEEEENTQDADDDEDSMILDISPEDIALTKDQTQAIETVAPPDDFSRTLDLGKVVSQIDDETDAADDAEEAESPEITTNTTAFDIAGVLLPDEEKAESADAEKEETESAGEAGVDAEPDAEAAAAEAGEEEPAEADEAAEEADGSGEVKLSDLAADLDRSLAEAAAREAEEAAKEAERVENLAAPAPEEQEETETEKETSLNDDESGASAEPVKEYEDLTTFIPVNEIKKKAAEEENSEAEEEAADNAEAADVSETADAAESENSEAEAAAEESSESGSDEEKAEPEDPAEKLSFAYRIKDEASKQEEIEEEPEEKHQSLGERLASIRDSFKAGKDNESEEQAEQDPARTVIEKNVSKAEPEKKPLASRIMQIVIVVLIIAIAIEFLIIGIKLFAPDSQGALLISRMEKSISGEAYGSYQALEESLGVNLNLPAADDAGTVISR